jgi:hypothetical protein
VDGAFRLKPTTAVGGVLDFTVAARVELPYKAPLFGRLYHSQSLREIFEIVLQLSKFRLGKPVQSSNERPDSNYGSAGKDQEDEVRIV